MAYEIYKKRLNREDYFKTWVPEEYQRLETELKDIIYNRYLMRSEVLIRDNFTCQNKNCKFCNNVKNYPNLTVHHVKAKRNGGKDIARNGVTLCSSIHKHYERAKGSFTLNGGSHLPKHIRGMTFKLHKPDTINWKKVRIEMKQFRKTLKNECGLRISWEQVRLLLKFLEMDFSKV